MVGIKKHEWKTCSISREHSANKAVLSTGSKVLSTPLLPSVTAHSEHQNSESQNFMLNQGPQGNATQANVVFWACIILLWGFVPPRRRYGWTKLIRIQANLLQVLPNCSFLSFIWLPLLQHLPTRYPFLTVWHYSKMNTVVPTNRWELRYLEVGFQIGAAMLKIPRFLQGAWISDRKLLPRNAWALCEEVKHLQIGLAIAHYTEECILGSRIAIRKC